MNQDQNKPPLKSLEELGAFEHGEKQTANIHRDDPLPKCSHKNIQIISSSEIRCSCGAGWFGPNAFKIAEVLKTT